MRSGLRINHAGWMAALALAAWGAAPASAEPVATLGQGVAPSAVTDAAGTLHVVWRQFQMPGHLLYCRVPAGTAACTPVQIAARVAGTPYLLLRPQDGALVAVFPSLDDTLDEVTSFVASGDGGTTWTGQLPVGVGMESISDAKLTPDGGFVDTVRSKGQQVLFQRVPLGGGIEQRIVSLGTYQNLRLPRLTHLPDGRPVAVAQYVAGRLGTRVAVPGADVGVPGSWSPFGAWRSLAGADASAGDAGPTGTWLLTTTLHRTRAGTLPVRIWRWGTRGFERPQSIGALARSPEQSVGGAQDTSKLALDVDLAGRLHAAWPLGRQACGGQQCIVYRRTDRRGFGPQIIYPLGAGLGDIMKRFSIAANSGGSGWLVWDDLSSRIRAVPLVTPPLGSRVGSRRIGTRRVSIPDFYGCVAPGGKFVHRVRVDGRRGTRIVSVRFFFDAGQPARVDHRAPWRVTFRLGYPSGTRHVAGAIVSYRLPGQSRLRTARIGRTFVMC
jgi:hypothetical protein